MNSLFLDASCPALLADEIHGVGGGCYFGGGGICSQLTSSRNSLLYCSGPAEPSEFSLVQDSFLPLSFLPHTFIPIVHMDPGSQRPSCYFLGEEKKKAS
jgi:hypothetical protein